MTPKAFLTAASMVLVAAGATAPATVVAPSPSAVTTPWADDLALIDREVRTRHPDPFANNPESAWTAKLAELATTLPTATTDEQTVQLASLIGLLDSHSSFSGPYRLYPLQAYRFAEGWFIILAPDPELVGARLVAVGGTPIEDVERALRPLIPADNEQGKRIGLQDLLSTVEVLHGLGLVTDESKPGYVVEKPDGERVTLDLPPQPVDGDFAKSIEVGYLMGDETEAIRRRGEAVWTRLDEATRTFLISYNDYTPTGLAPALKAVQAAFDDGQADRVVLDMRYLQGGDASLAFPLIDALKADARINRPGGLTVLIGRENVSAGTLVAGAFDRDTQALLIGEPTPARADNFLCPCHDIALTGSAFVIGIPTVQLGNHDERDAVVPDVPVDMTAADFFASRDRALELALSGPLPSPVP